MDPLIGQVVLGRYEVLQRIGSGGMGAVYVGRQVAVDRKIALKVLRTDLMNNEHVRMRFKREADIIAKLKHPNTIQLIDYGETDEGLAIMVMELLNGQSLSERLKSDGPIGLIPALRLGEEVCASLSEAHLYGLVHRDLKPANIFLNEVGKQWHTKVLDFGIARLLDEEATRLTSTGQVFGTPRYMSPEQAMSTADVDARSDLYSLGLIIYECIVGQPPFVAQTSIQYLSAHSTQTPPKLRERSQEAPAELEALIDRCLEKNADDRPQSAEEVGEALKQIRTMLELGTSPGLPLTAPRPASGVGASDTVQTNLTRPTDRTPPARAKTDRPVAAKSGPPILAIGLILAGLGTAAAGGWYFLGDQPAPIDGIDAQTVVALNEDDAPDAGAVAEVETPLDAGEVTAPPAADAGTVADPLDDPDGPDTDDPPPHRPTKRTKRHHPKNNTQAGDGVITGPRGLVLDVGEEGTNLAILAKDCTESTWRGLAKLTTKSCPTGCAIIVDDQCAGQTPAADRAMSSGRRNITVVCKGKPRRTATIRFEDEETTVFRCR